MMRMGVGDIKQISVDDSDLKLNVGGDRAHKKWHLIGIIWIRKQYGTPDASEFRSYIFR